MVALTAQMAVSAFLVSVEGSRETLANYYEKFVVFERKLAALAEQNGVAQVLLGQIRTRMQGSVTADGNGPAAFDLLLAQLASLFTEEGRERFAGELIDAMRIHLFEQSEEARKRDAATLQLYTALREKFCVVAESIRLLRGVKRALVLRAFKQYVEGRDIYERSWLLVSKAGTPQEWVLGTVAHILTNLPATEAVCERVISWFKYEFTEKQTHEDLIDAVMVIRAHQVEDARDV
jgi:hypothetical protein